MSNAARERHGYTLGLAGRHLLIGPFSPRVAMREGLTSVLGERGRFLIFAAAIALYALIDPDVRAALRSYIETVRQSARATDWALGVIILVVSLGFLIIVLYLSQSAILHATIRVGIRSKPTFVTTRSVVALGNWITAGLGCSLLLVTRGLLPDLSFGVRGIEIAILLAIIGPYLILFISEAAGSSLARSAAVLLLALLGEVAVLFGIDEGLNHLIAALRSFSPECDPA